MNYPVALLPYLSALPLIVALMGAADAFLLARTPLPQSSLPQERATLEVELRLALLEPLFSTGALLLLLLAGFTRGGLAPAAVALGSLGWIVGLPLRGAPMLDPDLRRVRHGLLHLSLGRWLTLVAPGVVLPQLWWLLSVVGAVLMWRTVHFARPHLATAPAPRRPSRSAATQPLPPAALATLPGQVQVPLVPPRVHVPIPAPPAVAPRLSAAEQLLRSGPAAPPLPCPGCGTRAPLREPVCPECGLLFASRVPPSLSAIARYGYHVVRPLGAGGMSSVYLAYDETTKGWCCVKTVVGVDQRGDTVWRAEAAASLAREAAILVELEHPRVSRLVDWLDEPRQPCLVLGLLAGPSLEQRLAAPGALPVAEACGWAVSLAEVLAYLAARAQPVVHGDLKPGNILLTGEPAQPTLVDFGSAVRLQAGGPLLEQHEAYGTPGYAAPEQYRGQLGVASDVYGLGATLYHLLSGDDPSLHPLQFPGLPALGGELQTLLGAMLRPEPGERPQPDALLAHLASLRHR